MQFLGLKSSLKCSFWRTLARVWEIVNATPIAGSDFLKLLVAYLFFVGIATSQPCQLQKHTTIGSRWSSTKNLDLFASQSIFHVHGDTHTHMYICIHIYIQLYTTIINNILSCKKMADTTMNQWDLGNCIGIWCELHYPLVIWHFANWSR